MFALSIMLEILSLLIRVLCSKDKDTENRGVRTRNNGGDKGRDGGQIRSRSLAWRISAFENSMKTPIMKMMRMMAMMILIMNDE